MEYGLHHLQIPLLPKDDSPFWSFFMENSLYRNPFLVIIWSFGLFILMNLYQYLGVWIGSLISDEDFETIISGKFENPKTILAKGLTALVIGIPAGYLIVMYLWRRPFDWMFFDLDLRFFLFGLLFGLLTPVLILVILSIIIEVKITARPSRLTVIEIISILIGYAGLALMTAFAEEFVFRGMMFVELTWQWKWVAATLVSGFVFGVTHLLSLIKGLTLRNALWIVVSGILVSYLLTSMLLRNGTLLFPIGFHAGWNFCLTALLGTKMSGTESSWGLVNTELKGPAVFTGGEFGLELSIISLVFYSLVATIFIFL
jgi:membrane protease YdiL (CAAX protease family)